jgi:hypothetical protein
MILHRTLEKCIKIDNLETQDKMELGGKYLLVLKSIMRYVKDS